MTKDELYFNKEQRVIGTFGQYTVQMSLNDLRQIANRELMKENKKLRKDVKKFNKAINNLGDQWHYMKKALGEVSEENSKLQTEISHLKSKLNKAKEVLKFYADSDCYEDFGRYGLSEVDEDGGEWAQKVLDEIKDNGL